jgi:hypothetical protein
MRAPSCALLLAIATAGCSYDWAYNPADASADVAVDQGSVDASDASVAADATGDSTTPVDASADVTDAEAAAEVSLPACTTPQLDAVHQQLAKALDCTGVTPNPCQVLVKDECGCSLYAATNNSAEAAYVAAVKQLLQTCDPTSSCPSGCNPHSAGICIIGDAGGATLTCH